MLDDSLNSPDLTEPLETRSFQVNWDIHDLLDSTNVRAHALVLQGAPQGTVVLADQQSRGKGRFGRQWESVPGVGLYLSLILKPPLQPDQLAPLTLMAGLAVAQTLAPEYCPAPELKWPNDVLLEGKKAAGILCEFCTEPNASAVIVGIGLNVNQTRDHFRPPLDQTATSLLLATGSPHSRITLVRKLILQLDSVYGEFLKDGPGAMLQRWSEFAGFLGNEITLTLKDRQVKGIAIEVDQEGRLILQTSAGLEKFSAGEVTLKPVQNPPENLPRTS